MKARRLVLLSALCVTACAKTNDTAGTSSNASPAPGVLLSVPNHVALPLYPKHVIKRGPYIDTTSHGMRVKLASLTTTDPIDTVAAWYASHLGFGFTEIRYTRGASNVVQFVMGVRTAVPEHHVDLSSPRDGKTTLVVTAAHEHA